jgi:hypothetical protein
LKITIQLTTFMGLWGSGLASFFGLVGTGGFIVDGVPVGATGGACFPLACDTGFVHFDTGALLVDGMRVSGDVRQIIQENGLGATTSSTSARY